MMFRLAWKRGKFSKYFSPTVQCMKRMYVIELSSNFEVTERERRTGSLYDPQSTRLGRPDESHSGKYQTRGQGPPVRTPFGLSLPGPPSRPAGFSARVPADALVQRLDKILVAPRTNAAVLVGCDVRRIERAEGQWEGQTLLQKAFPPGLCGGAAVGGAREIFAPRHHSGDAMRSAGWIAAGANKFHLCS